MSQIASTYHNNIHLDLLSLNQALHSINSKRPHGLQVHGGDFNIQTSWVSRSNDTLRDSMLAYSKRMSDIKRLRGINVYRNSQAQANYHSVPPSLYISNNNSSNSTSQQLAQRLSEQSIESGRRMYGPNNRLIRSLGTIKLEPLLGSQRSEETDTEHLPIKVHKVKRDKLPQLESPISHQIDERGTRPVKHIKVTISMPEPDEVTEDEEDDLDTEDGKPNVDGEVITSSIPGHDILVIEADKENVEEPAKKILTPLGANRKRPRKAKRMKLAKPKLDDINESETSSECNDSTQRSLDQSAESIADGYQELLYEVSHAQNKMLEQKKKTVALLKQTNYGFKTQKQEQRLTLQSYARRKLRHQLPPIPPPAAGEIKKIAFRYTIDSSPYQQILTN